MEKVKEGYKMTELGEIPVDWEVKNLIEVSQGKGEYGIGAVATEYVQGKPRYLRITDIGDESKLLFNDIKGLDDDEYKKYIMKQNDIVFARTGNTTGKSYVYDVKDGKLVYAGFLIKYSINPKFANVNFIKYVVQSKRYWDWVNVMSTRSGQPGINSNEYAKFLIQIPNIKEQQKISLILSSVDEQIEITDNLIEKTKELKKGLMQKLLTKGIGHSRFKDTEIGKIPEAWEIVTIGEICEIGRGRVISKKEIETNMGNYPVYSSQTTNNGCMGYISSYDFEGEYVTWTTDGVNAGTAFYREGKFNCTNVCGTLKVKDNQISTQFLSLVLNNFTDKYVVRNGNPKLMNNIMAIIKIPISKNVEEQNKISQLIFSADDQISKYESKKEKLQELKKGLMQKLLTGKIRVKV